MRVVVTVGVATVTVDAPVGARSGIDAEGGGDAGADLIDALAGAARRLVGVRQLRQLPSRLVLWTEDAGEVERLAAGVRTWLERRGCEVGWERRG